MPKMKSHRGLKKRVKLTGNGKNKKGKSRSAYIDKANLPAATSPVSTTKDFPAIPVPS